MKITRAGVDLAKSVFHVHAVDRHDKVQWQARLKRGQWLGALCDRLSPGAEIGMEACASAHHWGRELRIPSHVGQRFRVMSVQYSD